MISLILDTETTGLFRPKFPITDPIQPHLAEVAGVTLGNDLLESDSFSCCIKPAGWVMPDNVAKINGLTTDYLDRHGYPLADVLHIIEDSASYFDCAVCHNAPFDKSIMALSFQRAGFIESKFLHLPFFDTMAIMTPICQLPKKWGTGFKFPRLEESYEFVTGQKMTTKHIGLSDVRATAAVWRWIVENGHA